MIRTLAGAVAGAVAMFIIGFIFFATPLQRIVVDRLDDAQAAAVQQSLNANVQRTGTYYVPSPETPQQSVMYGQGGVATVHYNSSGFAADATSSIVGGFLHMLLVSLLLAAGLYVLAQHVSDFRQQVKVLGFGAVAAILFTRLGDPVWAHHAWDYAIYAFLADSIALIAAGVSILKLLPRRPEAPTTPAGATSDL
jgi:hypothetical protein